MPWVDPASPSVLTQVTVTGTYHAGDGRPASGKVTFTLNAPISNGDVTVSPSPITVELDAHGRFTQTLVATDDAGTVPQGVWYGVTEQIDGAQPRDYFVEVSQATNPVDISTLAPGQAGWQ